MKKTIDFTDYTYEYDSFYNQKNIYCLDERTSTDFTITFANNKQIDEFIKLLEYIKGENNGTEY